MDMEMRRRKEDTDESTRASAALLASPIIDNPL